MTPAQTGAAADATGRFFSRSAGIGRRRHGRGAAPVLDGRFSGGADAGSCYPAGKLSEQAQAGAPLLCAGGAAPPRGACLVAQEAAPEKKRSGHGITCQKSMLPGLLRQKEE